MYPGEQKQILYNLPLRLSQVHSIHHAHPPQDPERRERLVLRELSTVGVIGREEPGRGRREHIWP